MTRAFAASVRRRATGFLSVAALSVLFATGCGSGDEDSVTAQETARSESVVDRVLPPNIVTDEAIRDQKPGSPARALLEWWQAFQFGDVEMVVRLTTPEALRSIGRSRLERIVRQVGPGLQGIKPVSSRVSDDVASIRVELLTFAPRQADGKQSAKPTSASPGTFVVERDSEDRGWLFDDASFLHKLAKNADL
jgi:hypothetical protein